MLKKIIAVKNVGKFINSAHSGVQECPKTTLVLGGNGFGKTTLASILRSNGANDSAIIAGRARLGSGAAPDVELLFDSGKATFRNGAYSGQRRTSGVPGVMGGASEAYGARRLPLRVCQSPRGISLRFWISQ
jgi:wobble nucleotide-excising tRNase